MRVFTKSIIVCATENHNIKHFTKVNQSVQTFNKVNKNIRVYTIMVNRRIKVFTIENQSMNILL